MKPRALRPGDAIRIVSPASPVAEEKLAPGLEILEKAGFCVTLAPHALDSNDYLAGDDAARAGDLSEAFSDPKVSCVLCARGGYGSARLLPMLDLDSMAASGKMFVGFSDVTSLHLALGRRGLVTFHAPMLLSFVTPREDWVRQSFVSLLQGSAQAPPGAPSGECLVPGVAEGDVIGGCLCLLTDSLGTPEALDATGRILLIEDVDENPHRVDAMLTHLLASGVLQSAAGIVVGEMTNTDSMRDSTIGSRPWREIVQERLAPLGLPAVVGFPFGHAKGMLSLPLGIRARLDAVAGTLTYLESPCA